MQILDATRYIKKIPDTTNTTACKRFLSIIASLKVEDISTLVRLALKYPPAVRALIGALLEETGNISITEMLRKSLNPITTYKLSGVTNIISSAQNWNIKE